MLWVHLQPSAPNVVHVGAVRLDHNRQCFDSGAMGLDITLCTNSVNSAKLHAVLTCYVLATWYATMVVIAYRYNSCFAKNKQKLKNTFLFYYLDI